MLSVISLLTNLESAGVLSQLLHKVLVPFCKVWVQGSNKKYQEEFSKELMALSVLYCPRNKMRVNDFNLKPC